MTGTACDRSQADLWNRPAFRSHLPRFFLAPYLGPPFRGLEHSYVKCSVALYGRRTIPRDAWRRGQAPTLHLD